MKSFSSTNTHSDSEIFVESVDQLDCAVFFPNTGVIGSSWYVDLFLKGPIRGNGFVYDFSIVKSIARQALKKSLDHSLIVNSDVSYQLKGSQEHWQLDQNWSYLCPEGCVYQIDTKDITAQTLENEISKAIATELDDNAIHITTRLREKKSHAGTNAFQYTHGIPGHQGMCQRPLHGHSSTLELYQGDTRQTEWEKNISENLLGRNIHLSTPRHLTKNDTWEIGKKGPTNKNINLAYQGSHGSYEVSLPANKVLLLPEETSIECLTQFLAEYAKTTFKGQSPIKAICQEGVNKGAISIA